MDWGENIRLYYHGERQTGNTIMARDKQATETNNDTVPTQQQVIGSIMMEKEQLPVEAAQTMLATQTKVNMLMMHVIDAVKMMMMHVLHTEKMLMMHVLQNVVVTQLLMACCDFLDYSIQQYSAYSQQQFTQSLVKDAEGCGY